MLSINDFREKTIKLFDEADVVGMYDCNRCRCLMGEAVTGCTVLTQWMQIDFGVVRVGEKDAQVAVNGQATFVHGGKHKGSPSLQCIAR